MKHLIAVVLALAMGACSTVTASLGQRAPKRPAEETVRAYIRQNDETGAREFLLTWRPSLPDADMREYIVLAKQAVDRERARCAGKSNCAASAAKAAEPPKEQ